MDITIAGSVNRWATRFNAGEYFEAHEELEAAWLGAAEPEKSCLKGLIHVAVAFHHYRRGNAHGARAKYASGCGYLAPYGAAFLGVDLAALRAECEAFFAPLLQLPAGSAPPLPSTPWPRVRLIPQGSRRQG